MTEHVTEEHLILYHYGEPQPPTVAEHVDSCEDCRDRLAELRQSLALVDELPVPERSPDYADRVWDQLQSRMTPARVAAPPQRSSRMPMRLAWGAAMAASLILAFLLGQLTGDNGGSLPAITADAPGLVRERILLVAVGAHLERTQRLLIELTHAEGNGEVDIAAHQALADRLVTDNRLYRQTAVQAGGGGVGELLDELERLLVEVANGPERLDRESFRQLQRRIERQGLLFKVRVVGGEARRQAAPGLSPGV